MASWIEMAPIPLEHVNSRGKKHIRDLTISAKDDWLHIPGKPEPLIPQLTCNYFLLPCNHGYFLVEVKTYSYFRSVQYVCVLGSPWLSGFPLLLRLTAGAVLSCISLLLQLQLPQICCGISWPWCQPPRAAIRGQTVKTLHREFEGQSGFRSCLF